jgi:hypothetical protein
MFRCWHYIFLYMMFGCAEVLDLSQILIHSPTVYSAKSSMADKNKCFWENVDLQLGKHYFEKSYMGFPLRRHNKLNNFIC